MLMKISRKIKISVAFAMLAVMMLATTANAATTYTQKAKYADDTSYYHTKNEQDRINALKKCQIKSNDYYYETYHYMDLDIRASMYLNDLGWEVYDLKKMEDSINEGLESRYGYFFNTGFMATDDITDPTGMYYVCKCSQSDFNDFINKTVDSSWEHTYDERTHMTSYSKKYPGSIYYSIVYTPHNETLEADVTFLN